MLLTCLGILEMLEDTELENGESVLDPSKWVQTNYFHPNQIKFSVMQLEGRGERKGSNWKSKRDLAHSALLTHPRAALSPSGCCWDVSLLRWAPWFSDCKHRCIQPSFPDSSLFWWSWSVYFCLLSTHHHPTCPMISKSILSWVLTPMGNSDNEVLYTIQIWALDSM